jgi:hypothetical protein
LVAVAEAVGFAVLLLVAEDFAVVTGLAELFVVALTVTLGVALAVLLFVGVGDGFLVAALAVPFNNETANARTKNFLNRDPI